MERPIVAAAATLALLAGVACARGDKAENADVASNENESAAASESTPSMTPQESAAVTELAAAEPDTAPVAAPSERVGMGVFESAGQQVGVIDEIIVAEDGTEQAVISVGSYLGLGAKKIIVPTSDLTLDVDGARFTIAMTAAEIEAAPEYVKPE